MRTIKFRAKIKAESFELKLAMLDKSEGEWVCGDLHICDTKIPHIHCVMDKYPIDVSTIGQYTGLKDKNGKEIYEGDIVEWIFFYNDFSCNGGAMECEQLLKGVIEWYQGGFIFSVLENDFENACYYSISALHTDVQSDVSIIGNIHDNPELLKQE